MGRAAENLDRERRLNSARAFLEKANVLLFRFANAAERGSETDADPVVRFVVRVFDPGVVQREFRGSDRELCVPIKALQTMWRKKFFRVPIVDLAGDPNAKLAHV